MSNKFTDEAQKVVLEALRENPSLPSAATKAGVHVNTLRTWIEKGESGDEKYSRFALDCSDARMTMKDEVVAALYKTAIDELHPQQTKAAHMLLTNLFPREFAVVKHMVTHNTGEHDELDVSALSTAEARAMLTSLKKIRSANEDGEPRALPAAANVIEVVSANGKN